MAAGHPECGGGPADEAALRRFRLLAGVTEAWFLAGAGDRAPPPGVRIFQPLGPAEFLAEAEAGFDAGDLTQQDLDLLDRLGELLRRLSPQVVHLHDLAPFGVEFLALVRRECPAARIVVSLGDGAARRIGLADGAEGDPVPRFLRGALLRHALRGAAIQLSSEALRGACMGLGLDPARLAVVPPLPPQAAAGDPPPSVRFLVAAAFPGPADAAPLATAAGLLAALPPPAGRRLRIELHGGWEGQPLLEQAAALPFSPLAPMPPAGAEALMGAHLVLLPARDPGEAAAAALAHGRPAIPIRSGAALAETLAALLEAPEGLAALRDELPPPPTEAQIAEALLAAYRGLPA